MDAGREKWALELDAARRANFELFKAGAHGDDVRIAENYLRGARALFHLCEWHECSILANLSLKGLLNESDKPSRAGALLVLAKALVRQKDYGGAKRALGDLRGLNWEELLSSRELSELRELADNPEIEWPLKS